MLHSDTRNILGKMVFINKQYHSYIYMVKHTHDIGKLPWKHNICPIFNTDRKISNIFRISKHRKFLIKLPEVYNNSLP